VAENPPIVGKSEVTEPQVGNEAGWRASLLRWAIVFAVAFGILLIPVPEGITRPSWRLLAIFAATITGSIVQPIPGGAMVLLGVTAVALTGAMPVRDAFAGYADPIVWLVLAAFFISRAMIKTGLGRRIALVFIKAIGHDSLGLGYALIGTDVVLATIIPSTGARAGGIIFPIAKSLSEAYESRPGVTAERLGSFLMLLLYQCEVIICAMFLTGQASNVLIAKFAQQTAGVEMSYLRWMLWASVPGIVSLIVVPRLLYRIFPPQIKQTPGAAEFAKTELDKLGPMSRQEMILLVIFLVVAALWIIRGLSGWISGVAQAHPNRLLSTLSYISLLDYSIPPLVGVCVLLMTRVLDWDDIVGERSGWGVFIWYGGLVRLAEALGETGLTKKFAESAGSVTGGWPWFAALGVLLLIYFYAHYGFASITAHVTAMYIPFLLVILAAGAPTYLAVLSLAYLSNLGASVTHYGTTAGPIYFGAGYVGQRQWWWYGLIASFVNIPIWIIFGFAWWKVLRLW
jgi:DASS family divalent anion:Na+ symporter